MAIFHSVVNFGAVPIVAVAVLGLAVPAGAAPLEATCRDALVRDPGVRGADQAVREAAERLTMARSELFPKLGLSGAIATDSYQRATGPLALFARSADVHASQLLYDGTGAWERGLGAEAEREAVRQDRAVVAADAGLEVARAYLATMREQALAACAARYLAKHLKAVGEQEQVAKADPGKGFELEQIRTRAVYARSLVAERHAALKAAEASFRELTGAEPAALELPGALDGEGFTGLDEALAVADAHEPTIGAARQRASGTTAARKQAEAGLQPTFSLESLYRLGIDRDGLPGRNDEGYVGVQASFALSTGGAPTAAIRAARADELTAAARLEDARRSVREGVRLAWQYRQGLIARQPLVEDQLGWSGKVVEGFQQQFKAGRRSALELLTVQDQAYQAETDAIAVRFERRLADFELARREGTLSRWLPLDPPEVKK